MVANIWTPPPTVNDSGPETRGLDCNRPERERGVEREGGKREGGRERERERESWILTSWQQQTQSMCVIFILLLVVRVCVSSEFYLDLPDRKRRYCSCVQTEVRSGGSDKDFRKPT